MTDLPDQPLSDDDMTTSQAAGNGPVSPTPDYVGDGDGTDGDGTDGDGTDGRAI